ncbi:MAG: indolepyruvate oxidoreductase subunit beta [Christensenellales bacterium]
MNINVLIVGVGGQGTLLASRILGKIAENDGSDCKLSEVHGMAQRGGSVVTHVKAAEKVLSPIISEGDADVVLAFEQLEALRYVNYLKRDGTVIVNSQKILPMPVITGAEVYPENVTDVLKKECRFVIEVPALEIAESAENAKTVNTVMLGVLAKTVGLPYEEVKKAVIETVPEKVRNVNLEAFEKGYNFK